jgi:hypothetical protein
MRRRVIVEVTFRHPETHEVLGRASESMSIDTELLHGPNDVAQEFFSARIADLGTAAYVATWPRIPR